MRAWSQIEVEAAVADYLDMLELELRGESYNKAGHRRRLLEHLDRRSEGAIERKHQNISAALIQLGLPYVEGYKPLAHSQAMLREVVKERVEDAIQLLAAVADDVTRSAEVPEVDDILARRVDAPDSMHGPVWHPPAVREAPAEPRIGIDYLKREAANHSLGKAGELFVLRFEQARLVSRGLEHLAHRVEHTSATLGDGAGFDIHSFEDSGEDRLIEVKTTAYGRQTPFYVTRNELEVSRRAENRYHLYRIFGFRKDPRFFCKRGPLDREFALEPEQFRARIA